MRRLNHTTTITPKEKALTMKRFIPAVALAAVITLAIGAVPAFADSAPPSVEIPSAQALDQRCEITRTPGFYYADGAVIVRNMTPGVGRIVRNEAGQDVTQRAILLPAGRYSVEFTAPDGATFTDGRTSFVESATISAASPCGKPRTKVHRGAWHIVKLTAHRVVLRRVVRTTHYRVDMFSDSSGGTWVARTKVSRETIRISR